MFAALLSALYHQFLVRSIGSDNDIWNVVLPLFMLWALCAALRARTTSRQIWYGVLAGVVCGLHAGTWQGWRFSLFFLLAVFSAVCCCIAVSMLCNDEQDACGNPRRSKTTRESSGHSC